MRIIIVDDEPLARSRLCAQVRDNNLGEIVGEADNGVDALHLVALTAPDVVLLDIKMPGMNGIEAARHLSRLVRPPAIVFTTAYDEHALAAFEANAIDYLVKPVRSVRLEQALSKARVLSSAQTIGAESIGENSRRTHISGTTQGGLALVALERVRYFQADKGYVDTVWDAGSMLIDDPLRSLEDEFSNSFVRVHRKALVALKHITGLSRDSRGNYVISMAGIDVQIPVSRRLVSAVRRRLR